MFPQVHPISFKKNDTSFKAWKHAWKTTSIPSGDISPRNTALFQKGSQNTNINNSTNNKLNQKQQQKPPCQQKNPKYKPTQKNKN